VLEVEEEEQNGNSRNFASRLGNPRALFFENKKKRKRRRKPSTTFDGLHSYKPEWISTRQS